MNKDWEISELGDICGYQNGFAFKSKTYRESGTPVIRISDIQNGKIDTSSIVHVNRNDYDRDLSRYEIEKGDLLIAMSGATTGKIGLVETDETFLLNQRVGKFEPGEHLDKKYLFYYLLEKVEEVLKMSAGSAQPNLSTGQIKAFKIPVPSLDEQKRIVSILDETFDAVNEAKTNIDQNIENSEKLFQSKLDEVFSNSQDSWIQSRLGDTFRMKSGDYLAQKDMIPGDYPVYGGNGVAGTHEEYNLNGEQILIGRVGAQCGNVHLTNERLWLTDNAFRLTEFEYDFDSTFLKFLLEFKDLRKTARQTAQPVISNSSCKEVMLTFPKDLETQKKIASHIMKLEQEKEAIKKIYQKKIERISELKKSILKKAFSGELTQKEELVA